MKKHIRQDKQPENMKAHILETAVQTFARYGYEGTTVRDVCSKAGLSRGVIHYHWNSKEHLWQDVCKLCSERLFAIYLNAADFSQPPHKAVSLFFEKIFDDITDNPDLLRIGLWHTLEAEAFDFDATNIHFKPLNEFGIQYLKEHQASRGIEQDDIEIQVEFIRSMFILMVVDQKGQQHLFGKNMSDPEHKDRLKSRFVNTALHMLKLQDC